MYKGNSASYFADAGPGRERKREGSGTGIDMAHAGDAGSTLSLALSYHHPRHIGLPVILHIAGCSSGSPALLLIEAAVSKMAAGGDFCTPLYGSRITVLLSKSSVRIGLKVSDNILVDEMVNGELKVLQISQFKTGK